MDSFGYDPRVFGMVEGVGPGCWAWLLVKAEGTRNLMTC